MVHNLPENFNISDFDVFHSALLDTDNISDIVLYHIIITLEYWVCLGEKVSRRQLSWTDLKKSKSKYNELVKLSIVQKSFSFKFELDRPEQARVKI